MTKGYGTFFFGFFLGMQHSWCDPDMIKKLLSSLFVAGNVVFISFGLGLSDDGSDLFLLLVFSDFSVSVESVPVLFSEFFYFRPLLSLHFYPLLNP